MSENQENLIISIIKDLRNDNKTEHGDLKETIKGIIARQNITNGKITALKKNQIFLRGVALGIIFILFIFGFLPERLLDLFKTIF